MATINLTPNMNLPVPIPGSESGPQYGNDISNCFTILDQHTHANGSGVLITPAAININSAFSMNSNFITNSAGMTFTGQGSQPSNDTIYASNNTTGDLYYVNNAGLNIQLTNASGIVGSAGTISGITGTASASYSAPTFFWRSATGIAANMDFGSAIIRNITPNSTNAVTVSAPAALGSNYTLVLPTIPGSTLPVTLDNSGNLGTAQIIGSQIANLTVTAAQIANNTITATQIANNTITATQIANNTVTATQIANSTITQAQISISTLTSGTYTPSPNSAFGMSVVAIPAFQYLRVGHTCTVSGNLTVSFAGGAWAFALSLPIAGSVGFSTTNQCAGTGIGGTSNTPGNVVAVAASTTLFLCQGGASTAVGNETFVLSFTYQIT